MFHMIEKMSRFDYVCNVFIQPYASQCNKMCKDKVLDERLHNVAFMMMNQLHTFTLTHTHTREKHASVVTHRAQLSCCCLAHGNQRYWCEVRYALCCMFSIWQERRWGQDGELLLMFIAYYTTILFIKSAQDSLWHV